MVTRACISINNRCNLNCTYCHFHEKKDYIQEDNMDVITILDIITSHIEDNDIDLFKLGFVGNGEPMLDYEKLKQYIAHIGDYLKSGRIAAYTITNGLLVDCEKLEFFKEYNVNVGFSVDGISAIHDKYRCGTHERVMANIALYKEVNGKYPSMNCTVGKEIIDNPEATIGFFEQFGNRITFSRMIGKQGISLLDFNAFLNKAMERLNVRIKYTEYINALNDEVIVSDGHYSFMETVAFTEADGDLYDIFIYLYCSPENLKERYALSEKNAKFAGESIESLRQWQEFEINNLREECHRRNKDFYVVSDNEEEQNNFFDFLSLLREGFSSYDLATDICNQIMEQFNKQDILYMVDGDKTIIIQDSYRFCCNGKTKIFDGDFYTGYQSFLFEKELQTASIDKSKIAEITINNEVYDIVASNNYVVLSSGIKDLWSDIANAKNLGTIFASPYISADVKYYVVKQLREHGYTIFAYGDSKIDLYMLREADKGFLYIGKRISRSLKNESLSGLVPIYDHSLVILADEDEEVQADIAICKSNSGISGSRLAAAHVRLGEKIGRHIATVFPEKNTSILVLERGGRFFGDGVYMGAGGIFYSMNPKQDDAPVINTERVVIVDSVINTGKSIMRIIDELKNHNPGIDVIIAANVIQNEAVELFKDYLVFATRLSKNSFVGVNQSKQTGKTGPDTADRLFNLIKKRY